jgi:insulysin
MGSEKYPDQNEYHSYIQMCSGENNAFTSDNLTCYYLELETTFLKKGIEMLSWFFRKPLLDSKHILSEKEIINSEHQKNILSDPWIIDNLFKNFLKKKSKYTKFGTGNNKSLKNIKKEDILKFYDKYYTTDNYNICIIDSQPLQYMIDNYVNYSVCEYDDYSVCEYY